MSRKKQGVLIKTVTSAHDSSSSFIDIVKSFAVTKASKKGLIFLRNGEYEEDSRTFKELDQRASLVANQLREIDATGERALLLYPPGLDFIDGFLGSLYGGVIAVPAHMPRNRRGIPRIKAIGSDAKASVVLTTQQVMDHYRGMFDEVPELRHLHWIATDTIEPNPKPENASNSEITANSIAYLQYTSGSTGSPKGVIVSHANLRYNSELLYQAYGHSEKSITLSWLPAFHDMGLILGILQPIYSGCTGILMAPAAFMQRPVRWLQAISKYRVNTTGGPNFSYDLCFRKTTSEDIAKLDLRSWCLAYNGAEPVRWKTIEQFSEKFKSCGFKRNTFYPCYGLAEATLFVSGGNINDEPVYKNFDSIALEKGIAEAATSESKTRTLVECGTELPGQHIYIVDPERRAPVTGNGIGEIWIDGPSIAQGYWENNKESDSTFKATLKNSDKGAFLRTGDLGFIQNGRLYITGRLKDIIIIRGRNIYPQDVESAVELSHPSLRPNATAAFAIENEDSSIEDLIVIQELNYRQKPDYEKVIEAIQAAVFEEAEVKPAAVILIRPGTIKKTSSGKIQRKLMKDEYLNSRLKIVHSWHRQNSLPGETTTCSETHKTGLKILKTEVVEWLKTNIAKKAGTDTTKVDTKKPFIIYGLDSVDAVELAADLEEKFERPVPQTLVWDYPTIEEAANFLAELPDDRFIEKEPLQITPNAPIAVIGLSCRFPGADNPQSYWTLLSEGGDAISKISPNRMKLQTQICGSDIRSNANNQYYGGYLKDIDAFDAAFFEIAPREAERMDPQQRLLLELSWEALEYSGIAPSRLAGSETGVFIGISSSDYAHSQFTDVTDSDAYSGTGSAHSIAANRLSYFLDLRGPSVAIDTACSSSLVAVHTACSSLRSGESELALAGGVNVLVNPSVTETFSKAGMLSANGKCKTMDELADGYVRGEGCGIVVLKRLEDAKRDGNRILAIIRGSAINQDGKSNGLTAPNGLAQKQVITKALAQASVELGVVSYIELHGTGTPLGDPIEVNSLQEVLSNSQKNANRCALGAVKTNIGHLEAAAGIAGLVKVILSLSNRQIPKNLHFNKLNPKISLDSERFYIPEELTPWKTNNTPRIAGISSFGFGGTNAHVILQEYTNTSRAPQSNKTKLNLFCLSAKNKEDLTLQIDNYVNYLITNDQTTIDDLCFSANVGRTHFSERIAIVAHSSEQIVSALKNYRSGIDSQDLWSSNNSNSTRGPVFIFSGQSAFHLNSISNLYATQSAFKIAIDECDRIVGQSVCLKDFFTSITELNAPKSAALIQPIFFALEYALAQMWLSLGVTPSAVVGHSLGEFVAACIAGVMSLEDSIKLVEKRGQLMDSLLNKGCMLAIFDSADKVSELLGGYSNTVVAAINTPSHTVVSGSEDEISRLEKHCKNQLICTKLLDTSHAFHSPIIEPMLDDFEKFAKKLVYKTPVIPFVSTVSGNYYKTPIDSCYWRSQTRQAVQFEKAMATLSSKNLNFFLEIGPDNIFSTLARQCISDSSKQFCATIHKDKDSQLSILESLAKLYVQGVSIDWLKFADHHQGTLLELPTYPFSKQRFWHISDKNSTDHKHCKPFNIPLRLHPYVGPITYSGKDSSTFACEISRFENPEIADHKIGNTVVFPGACYLEAALAAGRYHLRRPMTQISDMHIRNPLIFSDNDSKILNISIQNDPNDDNLGNFKVYSEQPGVCGRRKLRTTLLQTTPGRIDGLRWEEVQRQKPKDNEVEIAVKASGLNFMDVMNALGMLPGDNSSNIPFGIECSGVVTRIGSNVTQYNIGDEVIAMGSGSFSTYLITPEYYVQPIPPDMTFDEAATLPVTYLTAYYALVKLGKLEKDEKILIHSAAGGVGIAAVKIALAIGATVYATASTQKKKELLIAQGVRAVFNSRSLDFAENIHQHTNGDGIDVVLNSLAGDGIEKTLSLLKHGGRFLELGKVDIYKNSKIGLYPFRKNLSYFAIDLAMMSRMQPKYTSQLFKEALAYIAEHNLNPLPHKVFDIKDTQAAFRYMTEGVHIGRILLKIDSSEYHSLGIEHCSGVLSSSYTINDNDCMDISDIFTRCTHRLSKKSIYRKFEQLNLNYGSVFQVIDCAHIGKNEIISELNHTYNDSFILNPAILDGALQTLGVLLLNDESISQNLYVPVKIDKFYIYGQVNTISHIYANTFGLSRHVDFDTDIVHGDIFLVDQNGTIQVAMQGVYLKNVPNHHLSKLFDKNTSLRTSASKKIHPENNWLFDIKWVNEFAKKTEYANENDTWYIFCNDDNLCNALAKLVLDHNRKCILIKIGENFSKPDTDTIIFNPSSKKDATSLASEIESCKGTKTIVNLWDCSSCQNGLLLTDSKYFQHSNIHHLYLFIQALGKQLSTTTTIWLITNYGQGINNTRKVIPNHSFFWALGKVINNEYKNLNCSGLDIELGNGNFDKWANIIYSEITQACHHDVWLAYCDNKRLKRVCIPQESRDTDFYQLPLKNGGVYLISGGQNGIGFEIASYIAQHVQAKLLLINRHSGHPNAARDSRFHALSQNGSEVIPVQGDVTNLAQMQSIVKELESSGERVDGVIHAAGVLKDSLITNMDYNEFEQVVLPKVVGASVLDEITKNYNLDFFVMFSSVASIVAPQGQSNHVVANSFLDAFAYYRKQIRSGLSLSINWGAWGETGVVSTERYRKILTDQGIHPLTTQEGINAFDQIIRTKRVQAVCCGFNENVRADFMKKLCVLSDININKSTLISKISAHVLSESDVNVAKTLRKYGNIYESLDSEMLKRANEVLLELGWDSNDTLQRNPEIVIKKLGIVPQHENLIRRILFYIDEKENNTYH